VERPIFSRACPFFYCSFSFGLEKKTHAQLKFNTVKIRAFLEMPVWSAELKFGLLSGFKLLSRYRGGFL